MDKSIFVIVVVSLVAVVLPGLSCTNAPGSEIPVIVSCDGIAEIGKPAPNFTWVGKDNVKHNLTDYQGQAVIITTWDILCSICIEDQLPYLAESYKKFTDQGVNILAINDMDTDKMLVEFINTKKYPFTVLSDRKGIDYKFRSNYLLKPGVPQFMLVDKNGILVGIIGGFSDTASMKNAIDNFVESQTRGVSYKKWEPLQITDVTIIKANSSFTVRCKTNSESTSRVYLNSTYNSVIGGKSDDLVVNHEIRTDYSKLQPDTEYSVSILSTDRDSNTATIDAKQTVIFSTASTSCGTIAPDFSLISQEGKFVRLRDFAGKKVLLHFWSYTCHICTEELPLFKSFYAGLPSDKIELITVSVGGDITEVNNYINERGYKFPVLFDSDGAADTKYKNVGFPTSYLVSANGCIIDKRDGKFDSLYDLREFTGTLY
jgi:peroxiredoxin